MATTPEAKTYARAADYVKGIGENLDSLMGRDVVLHSYTAEPRTIRGKDNTLLTMKISEIGSDEVKDFHAFSTPLAQRLADVPEDAFPVLVQFVKASTSGGFKVWSIE